MLHLGDWINYIDANLSQSPTPEERDCLADRSFGKHIDALEGRDPSENPEGHDHYMKAVIRHAIQVVEYRRLAGKINALRRALDLFEQMRFAARLQLPGAEVNLFRQGFLLLMTAFDAAAFDITRAAVRDHFFRLIAILAKKESIAVKQWSEFKSFDEFRDQFIEQQLKSYYLKDLLSALRKAGVAYCTAETDVIRITEMIQRRNVHVHNRGYVDERYMERDEKGTPKYNIFNLKLGGMAAIDESYWEIANRLTADCIKHFAHWATGGAATAAASGTGSQ
jgi:hypothetical protein